MVRGQGAAGGALHAAGGAPHGASARIWEFQSLFSNFLLPFPFLSCLSVLTYQAVGSGTKIKFLVWKARTGTWSQMHI